jgi:uncharacterized RDD family membrane protein YckC
MICGFCGSRNGDGEHRCGRCGRRPGDTLTPEYAYNRTQGPLALQPTVQELPPQQRASTSRPFQPSLFQGASNVIPFEAYAPVEPKSKQQRAEAAPVKPRAPRRPRVSEDQGTLDFLAPAPPKPRTLSTTVEAMIYCDSPVASKLHRAVAAGLDWAMVLIAYGMFLLTYYLMGGEVHLNNSTNIGVFGGVLLLFACVYGLMWSLMGAESMGMHWTGLRLLTFEGFPPERKHRALRFLGSSLGLCSIIGAAWSLVDEEGLGWQDYISRTFPTPREADNLVLVRR